MNRQNPGLIHAALAPLIALGGLACGFAPLLAVERFIPVFTHLYPLLISIYLCLFLSLGCLLAGARLLRGLSGLKLGGNFLRLLLAAGGVTITVYWHLHLNPMPIGPLLQGRMYLPLLVLAAAALLAWLPFIVALKKIF